MKKIIVLSLCLLACGTFVQAQVKWGLRAGVSASTIENNALYPQLDYESDASSEWIAGPNVALIARIPLGGNISLLTEAHYLRKGGRIQEDFALPNTGGPNVVATLETDYRTTYLELPVLFSYQILSEGKLRPFVLAGASYGRALRQEIKGDNLFFQNQNEVYVIAGDNSNLDWETRLPGTGGFNRNDLSAVAGMGISLQKGKQEFLLDARYLHDFTDWRTEKSNLNSEPQVRNRSLIFSIGILI
jgi:hypothetical protein